VLGHASEDETTESLAAVGRHNDQVGSPSFRRLKNLDARIANHDFDLVASFAIDFLASQALKLGSRGGLSSYRRAALPRVRWFRTEDSGSAVYIIRWFTRENWLQ
jgi:hypothetical protein